MGVFLSESLVNRRRGVRLFGGVKRLSGLRNHLAV